MDLTTARAIRAGIDATKLEGLHRDLYRKALDYAHIRATWALLSTGERLEKDRGRTLAHNAFIDACNILSRNMAKAGEDNAWRALLTDERKTIGDFACWLHALVAIEMR